jgi:hypothetical protein
MSWSSLASNQTVTEANLADAVTQGIFYAKSFIPQTNRELTLSAANNYVWLQSISKSSNQLVVKSNLNVAWVGPGPYNAYVYAVTPNVVYVSNNGGFTFRNINFPTGGNYNSIAGDTSASNIVAGSSITNNYIQTTNNGGIYTYSTSVSNVGGGYTFGSFYPLDIAMSDTGQYVAIVGKNTLGTSLGNITVAISTNYGASFTAYYGGYYSGTGNQAAVSVSGNGQCITYVGCNNGGGGSTNNNSWRYISTDYGSSFSYGGLSTNQIFMDVALNQTGATQVIVNKGTASTGNIFVSTNYGGSFQSKSTVGGGAYAGINNYGDVINVVCNLSSPSHSTVISSSNGGTNFYNQDTSGYISNVLGAATGALTPIPTTLRYLAAFQSNTCNYFNTVSTTGSNTYYAQPLSYGMYNPELIQKVYRRALNY